MGDRAILLFIDPFREFGAGPLFTPLIQRDHEGAAGDVRLDQLGLFCFPLGHATATPTPDILKLDMFNAVRAREALKKLGASKLSVFSLKLSDGDNGELQTTRQPESSASNQREERPAIDLRDRRSPARLP